MDPLDLITLPTRPLKALCRVPKDLAEVTSVDEEVAPAEVGATRKDVARIWNATQGVYRTGLYPAVQICVRRRGAVLLHRALGHASGNAPGADEDAPRIPCTTETPFRIYSASKAVTAMVVHKLDDLGALHIDDRVADYLPEFRGGDKEGMTVGHVLAHRAGIPNVPPGAMDLDLLERPDDIIRLIADQPLLWRPGRRLAYHAVTGGFVLGEVVRRATGLDIRAVLQKEVLDPMGLRYTNYGVKPIDAHRVAQDAVTGLPPIPPVSQIFQRILGVGFAEAVEMASDPRFLSGIMPAANVVTTARELSAFYQCLLDEGEYEGQQVFEPRTVHRATVEQSYWEMDLTMGLPIRYGLGFMLGSPVVSMWGVDSPQAFGHVGFTNVFSWADPDRDLAVAILTSGKPFLAAELVRLLWLIAEISRVFPREIS